MNNPRLQPGANQMTNMKTLKGFNRYHAPSELYNEARISLPPAYTGGYSYIALSEPIVELKTPGCGLVQRMGNAFCPGLTGTTTA